MQSACGRTRTSLRCTSTSSTGGPGARREKQEARSQEPGARIEIRSWAEEKARSQKPEARIEIRSWTRLEVRRQIGRPSDATSLPPRRRNTDRQQKASKPPPPPRPGPSGFWLLASAFSLLAPAFSIPPPPPTTSGFWLLASIMSLCDCRPA